MALALCGIPFLLLPTDTHTQNRVENHRIPHLSKVAAWHGKGQQVGFNSNMTQTCTPGVVCLRCLLCLNVPVVCSQCQTLMSSARLLVCVQVCAVMTPGSDRLRLSVEISRLQRAFSAYPRHRTHTNTRMQWSFQGVAAVCSLSLSPGGAARLTKPDWQCQELRAQRLDLHKNFELLQKCFFFEGGKSLSVQYEQSK